MTKKSRKYPKELEQETVILALRSPSIPRTATELGIPVPTLYTWIYQLTTCTATPASGAPPGWSPNGLAFANT